MKTRILLCISFAFISCKEKEISQEDHWEKMKEFGIQSFISKNSPGYKWNDGNNDKTSIYYDSIINVTKQQIIIDPEIVDIYVKDSVTYVLLNSNDFYFDLSISNIKKSSSQIVSKSKGYTSSIFLIKANSIMPRPYASEGEEHFGYKVNGEMIDFEFFEY